LLKGLVKQFTRSNSPCDVKSAERLKAVIIPRSEHPISRKDINPNALKVLYRLHQAGYAAYLVGGCVRDLLIGDHPKDFDVATNAHPEEIRKLFKNCLLIGRRFRLAHIRFGKDIIEVATFRANTENSPEHHALTAKGMIMRDNLYGTIEEDVLRRDFSINALYYNIADFSVIDFTGGMQDLKARKLRMIGNPEKRYHEDPVRLLRAIRFMGKLKLTLSDETEEPIIRLRTLLHDVSSARLFQEILKFFMGGASARTFEFLQKYHLLESIFPKTAHLLDQPETKKLIYTALKNTDERIQQGKPISPAFLFAVFLWPVIYNEMKKAGLKALHQTRVESIIYTALKDQKARLDFPKRLALPIREICLLQYRFTKRHGKQPHRSLSHPRFRAAYDLLLLRAMSGEPIGELSQWWEKFQSAVAE
jgi:poly(A) polymerase